MEPQGYGEWRRRWEALKAHLTGRMSDPRVAEARRQQQAVTGDRWSVKVNPRAFEWQAAAACAERGLYGAAAEWAIRASSEYRTCRIVHTEAPHA